MEGQDTVNPRVLVMGAGSGAGNNLVASLGSAIPSVVVMGCHHDPFTLKKSTAGRNYLLSPSPDVDELAWIIDKEGVDLVIPTSDAHLVLLSEHREVLGSHVWLPAKRVFDLCQDKYDLAMELARHGVPVPASLPVTDYEGLEDIVEKLRWSPRLWCRVRSGSRSLGAVPVRNAHQARAWIELWQTLQGVDPAAFMLAEYLPGRDYFCQSLWDNGRLVLVKTCERISYFGAENSPSGMASLYSLAKTVDEPAVVETCVRAVRALDPSATSTFGIDLKENAAGIPCITEINAGRIQIGMITIGRVGAHDMVDCYARLGLGWSLPPIEDPYDCPPDYYTVRDIDAPAGIFHADDIIDGFLRPGD